MTDTWLRALAIVALGAPLVPAQSSAQTAASPWVMSEAVVAPGTAPAPDHISILRGIAYRRDVSLRDGAIEFDLAAPGNGFAGLAFRMADTAGYEIIYFAPSDDGQRWASIQYQPVFDGETTWQLYSREGYQARIPSSVGPALHVRLLVAANRADVLLDGMAKPLLQIHDLKRNAAPGAIGFWAASPQDTSRPSSLSHLSVDERTVPALAALPPETAAPTQLMRWHVSPRQASPGALTPPASIPADIANGALAWAIVDAEPSGVVNLTQARGNPAGAQRVNVFGGAGFGLVYAHVTIGSDRARAVQLFLSFSDGAGVYLNGERLYFGHNERASRYPDYLGVVTEEVDGVDLRLRSGENDLILAVTDKAFGWGFRARLSSLDGLSVTP